MRLRFGPKSSERMLPDKSKATAMSIPLALTCDSPRTSRGWASATINSAGPATANRPAGRRPASVQAGNGPDQIHGRIDKGRALAGLALEPRQQWQQQQQQQSVGMGQGHGAAAAGAAATVDWISAGTSAAPFR